MNVIDANAVHSLVNCGHNNLARQLGDKGPRSTRIELKISHEELSHMIGTTRPRTSVFMQRFRNLGLIELTEEHYLSVME